MHCFANTGERTIFHSEETKPVLDSLYVCVCDEERLTSPQGGAGQVWVCRRGSPHPKGVPEDDSSTANALLCSAHPCSEGLDPPVGSSQGNGRQAREEEDAPCSPEALLTLCMKRLMIPDTDPVKDSEGVIPLPPYSRFPPS